MSRPNQRRTGLVDAIGLAALLGLLLDYFRPGLLLLPTIAAGGDTQSHYPTAVFLREELLSRGRIHGWYPGAYLGHPLLLYYFPLPFVVMAALAGVTGMPVAFKLGSVLGVFLMPLCVYLALRLMRFRFPAPLLGAGASVIFLFVEKNPIWGGTLASTLAGEFAYTYGAALGLLYLGVLYRAYSRGDGPWLPAACLALTALSHGYAVLWAGLTSTYLLFGARRPWFTLGYLLKVAVLAFALAGFWLLPLLADWGWTTAYDDPWITVTAHNLLPPRLWPFLGVAAAGGAFTLLTARRTGGADRRLLLLGFAGVVGTALALGGPALGIIDVRFVPLAQLAMVVLGGVVLGQWVGWMSSAPLAALGLVALTLVYADGPAKDLRAWIDWDYAGLEAKENWPAFARLARTLKELPGDSRVAVEYSKEHEKAGSIRMYETLPHFSGRPTLEGVYNQASVQTHAVYYLASELGAASPNPFRKREYAHFDTDAALAHLRLFNAGVIVALTEQLVTALEGRNDVERVASIRPYTVYRLRDFQSAYVEPLRHMPVRSSRRGWRDKAYRWFTRGGDAPLLVFTDDPRFTVVEPDEWLPPPVQPLPEGVAVKSELRGERLTLTTNRIGHPLLVKASYHPRWRATGADGPFLVSPALMMIVPREERVELSYAAWTWADRIGWSLTFAALLALALRRPLRRLRGQRAPRPWKASALDDCGLPKPPLRWGAAVPMSMLLLLAAGRLVPSERDRAAVATRLYEQARKAQAAGRHTDAAEYARHALGRAATPWLRARIGCLRGVSLSIGEQWAASAAAFDQALALDEDEEQACGGEALAAAVLVRERIGDLEGAAILRERLAQENGPPAASAGTP